MRDLHNHLVPEIHLAPAVIDATADPDMVDRQDFESLEFFVFAGAGGITFDASNKIELVMQEGDASDGSDAAAVEGIAAVLGAEAAVVSADEITDGIVKAFVEEHAAAAIYKFGYVGPKRYARLVPTFTGTHGTGTLLGIIAVKGHGRHVPAIA